VAHASTLGILVVNTPTSNVGAVAEHALMLMLATARRVVHADAATRRADTRFKHNHGTRSLAGKMLGVVGYGHTGERVAALAVAIGMEVVVWSPRADDQAVAAVGARRVATLPELLRAADVVSLHRPLRADTRHTLDRVALSLLKPTAIVVNTSRGGLIDEEALAEALREGRLFGAGLDVLAEEPMSRASPLAGLDNVVLTPHSAGSTEEALRETALRCAEQVLDVLNDRKPASLVEPGVWRRRRNRQQRS
jgi:D-3-phosphoglycerate dehydrogenase